MAEWVVRGAPWLLALCASCSNARERYEDFEQRARSIGFDAGSSPAQACEPPPERTLDGPALLAMETSLGPGLPFLFMGELTTRQNGPWLDVEFSYRALDARDRATLVGPTEHVGPFPILANGVFEARLPERTLAGEANPILPLLPVTSESVLSAQVCGSPSFFCGTLHGRSSYPVEAEVQGQFGFTLLDAKDPILPTRPRYGCSPDALAQAL